MLARMIRKIVQVHNEYGLHARPSTEISKISRASGPSTKITITNLSNGRVADAHSVIDLLSLGADKSQPVLVHVEGKNEEKVFSEIAYILEHFSVD